MRRTAAVFVTGILLLAAGSASAQGAAANGLPIVPVKGGWARYIAESSSGPVQVVMRVGGTEKHKGRTGRWIHVEFEIPGSGFATIGMLIAGDLAIPENVLKTVAQMPGMGK